MDTLTHALSGALLARATASEEPRAIPRRIAAGFFACAAPDLDFVFGYAGPVQYLLNHRGITHSLVLLPLWALGLSWLLAKILREPRGWKALYGISALAIAAHIAGDVELHRFAHINLARKEPRPYRPGDGFIAKLQAPYLPLEQAIWVTRPRYGYPPTHELVKHAWESPPLAFFREFADLPAFDGFSKGSVSV